jgi:hypothetical protein
MATRSGSEDRRWLAVCGRVVSPLLRAAAGRTYGKLLLQLGESRVACCELLAQLRQVPFRLVLRAKPVAARSAPNAFPASPEHQMPRAPRKSAARLRSGDAHLLLRDEVEVDLCPLQLRLGLALRARCSLRAAFDRVQLPAELVAFGVRLAQTRLQPYNARRTVKKSSAPVLPRPSERAR